jgi:Ni,Fe-hydrogenase III small subunit
VLQPYYDLLKLCRKEALAPSGASWFFLAAPLAAVAAYLTVPLLIPVLTTYGLPLGYMGDILGGGFLLSLASFLVATAALETGSPYAQLGSSRAKTFSAITEPVVLFVVFTVALLTGTDLPYALAATVRSSAGQVIRPAHLLASAALFMVILHETGRIPVETHTEEWEIQALLGPVYDIHRLGVFFTASPRHADVLLITGAGTVGMTAPLQATYVGMPDPKVVIAAGTDAVSGGLLSDRLTGVDGAVPVDVWVPGSPPSPFGILTALLAATGKLARGDKGAPR